MWPSMVTHTWNLCSAFIPSKVHTHSSEHTPGAVGSQCSGSSWGIGALLKGTSVVVLRVERALYIHSPTYNSCRTWDSNPQPLGYESESLTIRPRLPPKQLVTLRHEWLKSCSARKVPLLKKAYVQARLKFANDSEENWVKVLWSDETKIELFGINSTRHVWRRRNAAYDPGTPSPPSNMEVETLCFGGVFLLRGQDNCTASKGPCTARALITYGRTHNTRPRQWRSGSRRSTLRSWSGLASLQTLIP